MEDQSSSTILMTSEIVANYVAYNKISVEELEILIRSVRYTLDTLAAAPAAPEAETDLATAAQIKKSIRPDGLVSFIDGKTYKALKRHITRYGLSVVEYKAKYGLPYDYPMTSPEYSARRSQMAKSFGLGKERKAIESKSARTRKAKTTKQEV